MIKRLNTPPTSDAEFRQSLYSGEIFLISATAHSLEFVDRVRECVVAGLGDDFRHAHERFDAATYFEKIGRLRKQIYTTEEFHSHLNTIIRSTGFQLHQQAYDPARLRVVAHNGHLNDAAKPIYYGHRDTWYANHQAMLTWWIPLHDVNPPETFEFFPDYFSVPVENDSEIFDFDSWVSAGQAKRIGWQNRQTGKTAGYPSLKQSVDGTRVPVQANAGDILLFSGQHLHQTRENTTGLTRFSIDFRTVDLEDVKQEKQAMNIDNRSTGSSLGQFIRPSRTN